VERLERAGATVLRTDRDGAVVFRRRHDAWEVAVHPPR
jgi:beta-lactamase superfamily II metal-dependent hydrolase